MLFGEYRLFLIALHSVLTPISFKWNPFIKFSQKILKTLSHALETLIFEFLVEKCVEVVKRVIF